MGDLMDQYVTNKYFGNDALPDNEPISSGFVNVSSEERPMFHREKFNVRISGNIIDVAVSSNIMVIAYQGSRVKRIDLSNPAEVDMVEFSKNKDDEIYQLFLDPSANHLIVSMTSGESLYLGRNNKKPRLLAKIKSHKIECVGWNKPHTTETCTGQILFGTKNGLIIESEIDSEEKFLSMGAEKHSKVIFNVNENQDQNEPVCHLYMEKFMGKSLQKRFAVFVVTHSRFYQFVGDIGTESPVFLPVLTVFQPNLTPYMELPNTLGYSSFSLFYPKGKGAPRFFAWLTGPGVYFGTLDFKRSDVKTENITTNTRLLPTTETKPESPVSIHVTEFHCVLLYENRFEAICTINDEEDYVEAIPSVHGSMMKLRSDPSRKTLWAFSESQISQYKISNESRDVWKLYLERKEFDLAKEYCKHNDAQMDLVWRKQGESLYNEKKYQQAAQCYALSQVSFEEVALKFLQIRDTEALKIYLLKKLVDLKINDNTQVMMLVTWLIELYLNQLGDLRDRGEKDTRQYKTIEDDFRKFLHQSKVHACLELHRNVAYDLLSSHADTENLIFFAMLMKDYPRVIRHHIQQDDFHAALEVLKKQRDDYQGLFEQFSPTLMQHIPKELVELWKQRDLNPKKLIPALVTQTEQNGKLNMCAVDYLEYCVDKLQVKEQAIHNYLISLYCKMDDEAPLLKYLNRQGMDEKDVYYDKKYALRLCSENKKHLAAVKIYSAMELYEEAVDLALKEADTDTAKLYAEKPEHDDVLKKKLWCKVARHVVESEKDIARAMELLKECSLLKIEDILKFFPDFATIDHFKDAICDSLQDYNQHIEDLKCAMQEATDSAEVVRAEIHDIRNRYGTVAAQDKCDVCSYPLVTRSFYYFPCSHVFHADCLIAEVIKHLKDKQRTKLEDYLSQLSSMSTTPAVGSGTSITTNQQSREQLQEKIDDVVAGECILCGDIMIRSLDQPFIPADEFQQVLESWR